MTRLWDILTINSKREAMKKKQLSDEQKAHMAQVERIIEKRRKYRQFFEECGLEMTDDPYTEFLDTIGGRHAMNDYIAELRMALDLLHGNAIDAVDVKGAEAIVYCQALLERISRETRGS